MLHRRCLWMCDILLGFFVWGQRSLPYPPPLPVPQTAGGLWHFNNRLLPHSSVLCTAEKTTGKRKNWQKKGDLFSPHITSNKTLTTHVEPLTWTTKPFKIKQVKPYSKSLSPSEAVSTFTSRNMTYFGYLATQYLPLLCRNYSKNMEN